MERALEPTRKLQELLNRRFDSLMHFEKAFDENLRHSLKLQSQQYQEFFEQAFRHQEQLTKLHHIQQIEETINKNLLSTINHFQKSIDSIVKNRGLSTLGPIVNVGFLDDVERMAEAIQQRELIVRDDGAIEIDGETLSRSEVENTIEEFTELIEKYHDTDIIEKLSEYLKKVKNPVRVIVFYLIDRILITVIIGIALIVYEPQIKQGLTAIGINKQQEKKQIKKEITTDFSPETLIKYRFVTADLLNVRQKPKRKSRAVTQIRFGRVVKVLQKKGKWRLIEFHDKQTGETNNGWVYSKHLEKFEK